MIFLFRFDVVGNGIDFVLNETIAEDMEPDLEEMLRTLVMPACDLLLMYKHHSKSNPIFKGWIHDSGELEVKLSPELGQYIEEDTKQLLFENGKLIATVLGEVMNRGTAKDQQRNQQPNHLSIEHLPLITHLIDESLEEAENQYQNLLEAKPKPYVLDDHTIQRIINLYTDELELNPVHEQQLKRWLKKENLTPSQRSEIKRLQSQLKRYRKVSLDLLELAREIEKVTIDKLLAKSDLEVGIEALLKGKF
jgi:hypothetical protein